MIISLTTSKGFNIPSMFIKLIENRPYSHIAMSWFSPSIDRNIYYHSTSMGVHFINSENFHAHNEVVKQYKLELDRDVSKKMLQKCVDLAGGGYDFINIAKIAVNKFINIFGLNINWKSNGDKLNICSELILNVLLCVFPEIQLTKEVDFYTPSDLDDLMEKLSQDHPLIIKRVH